MNDLLTALNHADLADDVLLRIAHCYASLTDDHKVKTKRVLDVIGPRIVESSGDHDRVAAFLAEVLWVAG